ncbi:PEP-CTERM sorting domain-containing protein [Hydrogenophaga sp. PBL-H3]|uniref:PEP-CTERM sorting domain-containing protein n=1 Tax=Hydrogenophaga sp. PBL-H3 TaxID=434010 RepID=UPI00131F4A63|nr:PEP-CTERM sorting domain-containing protein [Hydrogenophaga sp. PBL-H3]QHE74671.1 PEP-CTERM sorting domain-containing protein [Hydrogenophaga sp. PBL-H3]QHE79096.1 PEP-CTERM sorting domain-containing protein [Hydrogenophaga sp. PBL-H3]
MPFALEKLLPNFWGTSLNQLMKCVFCACAALASLPALAGVVVGATSISSPQGNFAGSFDLGNIINQSGLSAGYVNGVTDFDAYTAVTTHTGLRAGFTGFTASLNEGPQQFTFNLGSVLTVNALAIWNTTSTGAITQIRVLLDDDDVFGNGFTSELVGSSGLGLSEAAQVFNFSAIDAQYIHIEGLASLLPRAVYGLGEVVFSATPESTVPEPSTLPLIGAALVGLVLARRRV